MLICLQIIDLYHKLFMVRLLSFCNYVRNFLNIKYLSFFLFLLIGAQPVVYSMEASSQNSFMQNLFDKDLAQSIIVSVVSISVAFGFWTFVEYIRSSFLNNSYKPHKFSKDDKDEWVGDLPDEIGTVINAILNPQSYKEIGLNPYQNVFLYGPPGTGKSLLARTIALRTGSYFFAQSVSLLFDKHVGETAKKIEGLFVSAIKFSSKGPVVILFDEIDSFGNKKILDPSHNQENIQVINHLLVKIDELKTKGFPIIIIGATNFKNNVDGALIREDRFDVHLEIKELSKETKSKLIESLCEKYKVKDQMGDIEKKVNHKNTPAEVKGLFDQAARRALGQKKKKVDLGCFDFVIKNSMNLIPLECD